MDRPGALLAWVSRGANYGVESLDWLPSLLPVSRLIVVRGIHEKRFSVDEGPRALPNDLNECKPFALMHDSRPTLMYVLSEILAKAIREDQAMAGNVQMLNAAKGTLEIVVQHGFPQSFLDRFLTVRTTDSSVCGRAFRLGKRVTEFDVSSDAQFHPYLDVARDSGFTSVQSTPILDSDGCVIGVLSTHFAKPHRLSAAAAAALDKYACEAGKVIERYLAPAKV